ncbi:plastocyanin/azurin family copper-binding protein [Prauserella oleivorans]
MTVLALAGMGVVFAGPTASAATHTVQQRNFQFVPGTLDIAAGDTVTWTNDETDGSVHSVVQSGGSEINSPDIPAGGRFSHTFNSEGTYNLTCRFHPDMFMTVNVGGGEATPATDDYPTDDDTAADHHRAAVQHDDSAVQHDVGIAVGDTHRDVHVRSHRYADQ